MTRHWTHWIASCGCSRSSGAEISTASARLAAVEKSAEERLAAVRDAERELGELEAKIVALNDTLANLEAQARPAARPAIRSALIQADQIDSTITHAGARLAAAAADGSESRYGSTRVDIFYCEDMPAARALSERAAAIPHDATSRWRVRRLSSAINAQTGYRVDGNVIRHNADETTVARALAADVKERLGIDVVTQQIAYPTPNYISMFLCAGNAP